MICFETERLQVRHLKPADLDGLAALCADPLVMRYMGDGTTLPREGCSYWIDVCQVKYRDRGYGTSGVFEKASGEFVGYCGVVRAPENDFDEIIYALTQRSWGKGYATEVARAMLEYVFGVSQLDEIYATIHPDNLPSQKVMAKIGMDFLEDRRNEDDSITRVYVIRRAQHQQG